MSTNSDIIVYNCVLCVLNVSNHLVIHRQTPTTISYSGIDVCSNEDLPTEWVFLSKSGNTQIVGHNTDVYFDKIHIITTIYLTGHGSVTLHVAMKIIDPTNIGLKCTIFNMYPNATYA